MVAAKRSKKNGDADANAFTTSRRVTRSMKAEASQLDDSVYSVRSSRPSLLPIKETDGRQNANREPRAAKAHIKAEPASPPSQLGKRKRASSTKRTRPSTTSTSKSAPESTPKRTFKRASKPSPSSPSPSSSSSSSVSSPEPPAYEYASAPVAGVTSLTPSDAAGTRWRLLRSEYRLPIPRFVPSTDGSVRLVQSRLSHSLYALLVQAILWNQTMGKQARPVLEALLARWPDPHGLAGADRDELAALLQPIGLFNSRAKRLVDLAATWVASPPLPGRGYARTRDRKYVDLPLDVLDDEDGEDDDDDDDDDDEAGVKEEDGEGNGVKKEEQEDDGGQAVKPELSHELLRDAYDRSSATHWEIAHLPGVGPYALDSFRIFHRDEMRGLAEDWLGSGAKDPAFEPEWKRVVPGDKDLRAYLKYLWREEGWDWDMITGKKKRLVALIS